MLSWFSVGRRIIEPKYLTEQLQKWCEDCQQELNITRVVEETRSGLGIRYIKLDTLQQPRHLNKDLAP